MESQRQCMHVHILQLYPLSTRSEISVSNSLTAMFWGGSDTKAGRKPTPFAKYLAILIQEENLGFLPQNDGTAVCLKESINGRRS